MLRRHGLRNSFSFLSFCSCFIGCACVFLCVAAAAFAFAFAVGVAVGVGVDAKELLRSFPCLTTKIIFFHPYPAIAAVGKGGPDCQQC